MLWQWSENRNLRDLALKSFSYRPSYSHGQALVYFGNQLPALKASLKTSPSIRKFDTATVYIVDKRLPPSVINETIEITNIAPCGIIEVNSERKSVKELNYIWARMLSIQPGAAVVVGGGTIGDIAGLACGTYYKGIPRIFFPTTTLAMADAAIGGKNAIDYSNVKNSIGITRCPEIAVCYTPFLKTLEQKEYQAGFAEVIKAAVIYDETFFGKLERLTENDIQARDSNKLLNILAQSASIKAKICEEPYKNEIRLLYGHAIGHALEKVIDGKVRHGECVTIGMNLEGLLAVQLGLWKSAEWENQKRLIKKFHLPVALPKGIDINRLISKMFDYKRLAHNDKLLFALPEKIGHIANQNTGSVVCVEKPKVRDFLQMNRRTNR